MLDPTPFMYKIANVKYTNPKYPKKKGTTKENGKKCLVQYQSYQSVISITNLQKHLNNGRKTLFF